MKNTFQEILLYISEKKRIYVIAILYILIVGSFFNFYTMKGKLSSTWHFPYYSGSVNTHLGSPWTYSDIGMKEFRSATLKDQILWDFPVVDSQFQYSYKYNDIGFLYVVIFARHLFISFPPILSVMLLHSIVHILVSVLVVQILIRKKTTPLAIVLFIILYAGNPLILYFVTFPYYYFWQIIPSVLWLFVLDNRELKVWSYILIFLLGVFSVLIRVTTVIPVLALFYYMILRRRKATAIVSTVLLGLIFILAFPLINSKAPWHTMYVGLGAYNGTPVLDLTDGVGYNEYEAQTGKEIITYIPEKSFNDNIERGLYYDFIKSEYIGIIKDNPVILLRNAVLNYMMACGLGYHTTLMAVNFASFLIGVLIVGISLLLPNKVLSVALIANPFAYAMYYPPIAAYNFGNYLIIVMIIVTFIDSKTKYIHSG